MQEDCHANAGSMLHEKEVVGNKILQFVGTFCYVAKKCLDHAGVKEGQFFAPFVGPVG
jgi:hypothetical protein